MGSLITIQLKTSRRVEAIDITRQLVDANRTLGLALVSTPHTTACLLLTENEDDLLRDIERVGADLLAPLEPFAHAQKGNRNAAAHIFGSLAGSQLIVPFNDGGIGLGTYQSVVFLELDGPRERTVELRAIN